MNDQPISPTDANAMIDAYAKYMENLGVDMKTQTVSVSFKGASLMAWLLEAMPKADELRIFMGAQKKDGSASERTTVILWPYKDGKPFGNPAEGLSGEEGGGDPYNMGKLNP